MTTTVTDTTKARLPRRTAVMLVFGAGLALLGLGAVPWVRGNALVPGAALQEVSSSGGEAAPMIPALGLVLLAAAVALALARRVGSIITCIIIAAAGVLTTVGSIIVLNDPANAISGQMTEVTAIVMSPDALNDVTITVWVAVAAVFGIVVLGLALVVWRTASTWTVDARHEKVTPRNETVVSENGPDIADADLWDMLSDGQDPTP